MIKRIALTLISYLFLQLEGTNLEAQNTDSLWRIYNNKKVPDTIRIDALDELRAYYSDLNPDSGLTLAKMELEFSKSMSNLRWKAIAEFGMAYGNYVKGNYRDAISHYQKSKVLYTKGNRKRGVANTNSNMALSYLKLGNYDSAFYYYNEALTTFVALKDTNFMARTINQFAMIRDYQGRWMEALDYYFNALRLMEQSKDEYGQSVILVNIATIYNEMHDMKTGKKYLERALKLKQKIKDEYGEAIVISIMANEEIENRNFEPAKQKLNRALSIFSKIDDQEKLSKAYCSFGRLYYESGNWKLGLDFMEKGIALQRKLELYNDLTGTLHGLGRIYLKMKQADKALAACEEGQKLSRKIGNRDNERACFECLYQAWESKGNSLKALENFKKFVAVKDSLINDDNTRESTRKEMQFNFAKKQFADSVDFAQKTAIKNLELREKEATIKSERAQKTALFIGAGLLLVLGGVSYRSYRIKKKDNLLIARQKAEVEFQKSEIEKQRDEIRQQKQIVDEKQKEIIDSITYARRIQRTLLTNEKQIEKILQKLKSKN